MRLALDSNVLLYSVGIAKVPTDHAKTAFIRPLIDKLEISEEIVCPWQTFGEAYHVMQRYGITRDKCRITLDDWRTRFEVVASNNAAFADAVQLATDHKLQFWDALIINVAAEAGCTLLLSEDLQPGFAWRGVTIANPFAETLDERLVRILNTPL